MLYHNVTFRFLTGNKVDKITRLNTLHCIKGISAKLLEHVVCDTKSTL
jgi:hypothetical protein